MNSRKEPFVNNEHYHIFSRGIDKRQTFMDTTDVERFVQSIKEFNALDSIGSIFENSFRKKKQSEYVVSKEKLVEFICYCINPNHYHFILKQLVDGGISEFMKRMGGYTKFFNEKYNRSGSLFERPFKSVHISSDSYLLHLSVYVNLNYKVHQLGRNTSKLVRSSWDEYMGKTEGFCICNKDIILGRFNNINEYKEFAIKTLPDIIERKQDLRNMLLEEEEDEHLDDLDVLRPSD